MNRRSLLAGIVLSLCSPLLLAQDGEKKPPLSPPAKAEVTLGSTTVKIDYSAPSMRGRKIIGELVPYGQVWRTGANPATTFVVSGDVKVGAKAVAAGSYTLYTLPTNDGWKLIINMQTGQWGTEYHEDRDLVRVDMNVDKLPSPQETMSISFEKTSGKTTELHIKWESTDVWVPVIAK